MTRCYHGPHSDVVSLPVSRVGLYHKSNFWNLVPQQGLVWSKSAGFRTIFSFWNHVVYQTVCYGSQRISLDGWILCVPKTYNKLRPPYFIKLCLNIHPEIPLKCDFSIWARPNPFSFWSANFQIKLAPLILYTTLVYTSSLKSTV